MYAELKWCRDENDLLVDNWRLVKYVEAEALLFKVLADSTRLRLAMLLLSQEEICVCQLAHALDVPQFNVSRHLGIMRTAGMIMARREGTWMHYRLIEPCDKLAQGLHESLRLGLWDHPVAVEDRKRLQEVACKKK